MINKATIEKWLAGKLESDKVSKQEEVLFARLDKELSKRKAPEFYVEEALQNFHERKMPKQKQVSLFATSWIRYAAAVAILIIGYFTWEGLMDMRSTTHVLAENGSTIVHYLPDSSRVTINASSSIAYDPEKWGNDRLLDLQGEAFFEVKKGSSFEVNTAQGLVTVLGTKFNIRDREGIYEVECYEGRVKVISYTAKSDKILEFGDKIQVLHGTVTTVSSNYGRESAPSWTAQRVTFQSTPIGIVLEEIERQFDVSVSNRDVDLNQKFTGSFSKNNLKVALETIAESMTLQYRIDNEQQVLIYSEKP